MAPEVWSDSGLLGIHASLLIVPGCMPMGTGSQHVVDYCIVSAMPSPSLSICHMHMPCVAHAILEVVVQHLESHVVHAMYTAHTKHSENDESPAILGTAVPEIILNNNVYWVWVVSPFVCSNARAIFSPN